VVGTCTQRLMVGCAALGDKRKAAQRIGVPCSMLGAVHAWAASEVTGVTRLTAVRAEGCVGWQLTRSAQPAMLGQVGGALSLAWHLCWPANSCACRHWAGGGVACVMQVRACRVDWMCSQSVLSGRGDLL
jgi:hypothetical protein